VEPQKDYREKMETWHGFNICLSFNKSDMENLLTDFTSIREGSSELRGPWCWRLKISLSFLLLIKYKFTTNLDKWICLALNAICIVLLEIKTEITWVSRCRSFAESLYCFRILTLCHYCICTSTCYARDGLLTISYFDWCLIWYFGKTNM
jgi:hypothetical protein